MKGLSLEAAARRIVPIAEELGAEETTARVSRGAWKWWKKNVHR